MKVREYTNKLLTILDNGDLDYQTVLEELLMYMSEAEVEDFFTGSTIFDDFED